MDNCEDLIVSNGRMQSNLRCKKLLGLPDMRALIIPAAQTTEPDDITGLMPCPWKFRSVARRQAGVIKSGIVVLQSAFLRFLIPRRSN